MSSCILLIASVGTCSSYHTCDLHNVDMSFMPKPILSHSASWLSTCALGWHDNAVYLHGDCHAGAVISSATVSVQTQSATLSAGRRLLAADSDSSSADNRWGVQYVTRGNHLIATRPGKALGEELTEVSNLG